MRGAHGSHPSTSVTTGKSSRIRMRLVVLHDAVPAVVVTLAGFAELLGLFPSAMLQLDAGAGAVGDEADFDLRGDVPTGRAPGEREQGRRLIRCDPSDFVFRAVGSAFVKAPADARLD